MSTLSMVTCAERYWPHMNRQNGGRCKSLSMSMKLTSLSRSSMMLARGAVSPSSGIVPSKITLGMEKLVASPPPKSVSGALPPGLGVRDHFTERETDSDVGLYMNATDCPFFEPSTTSILAF
ncbi:MAG: hypothetical protein R2873_10175 [Caldilineaceae bacterium]